MIGRIVWTAFLILLGAFTAGLQLDRQSESTKALAVAVPPVFRAYAQRIVAVETVRAEDPAAGLAAAQELVRRRPMPAENLTILSVAQARAGNLQAAGLTIQLAGKRGWRELFAQEAVMRLALEAGDTPEAARRYAALFRDATTPDAKLAQFAPAVLGEPRGPGQIAFATVIAGAESWYAQYLQRGAQVLPPAVFGEVTGLALERGAKFPCDQLNATLAALRGRDAAAGQQLAVPVAKACP